MDIFEVVALALSFVVGLGMTQMLASLVGVIRGRKERRIDWLPLAWAASIFVFHVQYWFAIYDMNQQLDAWTWGTFIPTLVLAGLLFLSGGLILPSESAPSFQSLDAYFREHGRLSLVFLALYIVPYIPMNMYTHGDTLFTAGNLPNYPLVLFLGIGFISQRRAVQALAWVLFATVQAYAIVFVWARSALG